MDNTFYILVDTGELATSSILLKTDLRRAGLWAQIHKLEGKTKISGPALRGSALSVFSLEQLQYIYWNTFQQAPTDNYGQLIKDIIQAAEQMELDETPVKTLEKKIHFLTPYVEAATPDEKKEKQKVKRQKRDADNPRPASGTTTGAVWDICDELNKKLDRIPDRKEAMVACEEEGINPATASTQYGKWKKVLQNG